MFFLFSFSDADGGDWGADDISHAASGDARGKWPDFKHFYKIFYVHYNEYYYFFGAFPLRALPPEIFVHYTLQWTP